MAAMREPVPSVSSDERARALCEQGEEPFVLMLVQAGQEVADQRDGFIEGVAPQSSGNVVENIAHTSYSCTLRRAGGSDMIRCDEYMEK